MDSSIEYTFFSHHFDKPSAAVYILHDSHSKAVNSAHLLLYEKSSILNSHETHQIATRDNT